MPPHPRSTPRSTPRLPPPGRQTASQPPSAHPPVASRGGTGPLAIAASQRAAGFQGILSHTHTLTQTFTYTPSHTHIYTHNFTGYSHFQSPSPYLSLSTTLSLPLTFDLLLPPLFVFMSLCSTFSFCSFSFSIPLFIPPYTPWTLIVPLHLSLSACLSLSEIYNLLNLS